MSLIFSQLSLANSEVNPTIFHDFFNHNLHFQVSPVITRTKRHTYKLQRLAAVEDEEAPAIHRSGVVKLLPCDFG